MADVKMCDRCGRFNYSQKRDVGEVTCANGQLRTLTTIGNSCYDFDLCPDCVSELVDWFTKGVPKNEKPGEKV